MAQPRRIDHDKLLDLWASGVPAKEILPQLPDANHIQSVFNTVARYRLRGEARAARRHGGPTCLAGHPFDEANTIMGSNGCRRCRACIARRAS